MRALALAAICLALCCAPASSQTPPTPSELSAYTGLHAAAARGSAEEVKKLATAGGLDTRDRNGRTPLHVATFQKRPEIVKVLIAAGANHALLDNQRYDAVTIAAEVEIGSSLLGQSDVNDPAQRPAANTATPEWIRYCHLILSTNEFLYVD